MGKMAESTTLQMRQALESGLHGVLELLAKNSKPESILDALNLIIQQQFPEVELERRRAERALRYRREFERLIMILSTAFINTPLNEIDLQIQNALEKVGRFQDVDRSYIFLLRADGTLMDNTHEWCREGIEPQISRLQHLPTTLFPWWMAQLQRLNSIHIANLDELPPEARTERREFEYSQIQSIVASPLIFSGTLVGFFGFDSVRQRRTWSEDTLALLRLVGEILTSTLARKWADDELKASREILRHNENHFRLTLETIPLAIAIVTIEGEIVSVNKAFAELSGYGANELLHRPLDSLVSAGDLEQLAQMEERFRMGQISEFELPGGFTRKDGEVISIIQRIGKLGTADDGSTQLLVEIERSQQRKISEDEFEDQARSDSVGIVCGGIAHDFNNILTSIMGYTTLLQNDRSLAVEVRDRINDIAKGAEQGRQLSRQLIDLARGSFTEHKPMALSQIVKDAVSFIQHSNNTACQIRMPEELWRVLADEGQLSQVIHNLLINARESMPHGGVIRVVCENTFIDEPRSTNGSNTARRRYVRIGVSDEGEGIEKEQLSLIFKPFFSTKQRGSGLGLATSQLIVKRHGGFITVQSSVGSGSTFSVFLPALDDEELSDRESRPQTVGKRILVMDDDDMVRETAGNMLNHLGYSVQFAAEGAQAVDLYEQARRGGLPFDAVILDLSVQHGMGGRSAIRQLKLLDPNVKAIVTSGYVNDPVIVHYDRYGFLGVVPKPYEIGFLSRVVEKVLCG